MTTVCGSIIDTSSSSNNKTMRPASEQRLRTMGSPSSPNSNNKAKRKSTSLPPETVEYLKNWMMSPEHIAHPYPTEQEKADIMKETGIELKQLTNWFVNNRKRYWKPRVEARLQEQAKAEAAAAVSTSYPEGTNHRSSNTQNKSHLVTPTRRHSLVHVVSSPNVSALVGETANHTISEVSSSASESGSVGMTMDQDEESMSAGQATTDEYPLTSKETAFANVVSPFVVRTPTEVASLVKDDMAQTYVGCEILYGLASKESHAHLKEEANCLKDESLNHREGNNDQPSKRKSVESQDDIAPRPKYRRQSVETWRKACEEANHGYCKTLPTLEEAARLFGFAA